MRFLAFLCVVFIFGVSQGNAAYDKPYVGEMKEIRAKYEDSFIYIARDYNLGYVEMRAANPLVDPWVPGRGTKLILPTRHLLPGKSRDGLVINLPEMRLYYFDKKGNAPVTFPIGVGREGLKTPTGKTKIVRKKERPTWRPTPRMREDDPSLPQSVGPGPKNPLGTHALYLGWPEYLIHGTNRPFGIGRRISSGCIRMYPEDIIDLFGQVPVGTTVNVVDQPIKMAWIDNRFYLEAHPTMAQSIAMEEMGEVKEGKMTAVHKRRIEKFAGDDQNKIRWAAVRVVLKERRGYPVEIARRSARPISDAERKAALEQDDEQDMDVAENVEPQAGAEKEVGVDEPDVRYHALTSSRMGNYGHHFSVTARRVVQDDVSDDVVEDGEEEE